MLNSSALVQNSMQHSTPRGYQQKFEGFINLCKEAQANGVSQVVISAPWVIGDSYEEIVESLWWLADAGLALSIVRD